MTDIRKKIAGKTTKLAQDRPKQDDHPANVNDCQEGSYYHLDINLILPDPEQPGDYFDLGALEELANSIRQNRLYQPIVFNSPCSRVYLGIHPSIFFAFLELRYCFFISQAAWFNIR